MTRQFGLGLLTVVLTMATVTMWCPADEPKANSDGFKMLFNGKDLTGWEGPTEFWSVSDGMIVAESTKEKPCPKTNYLFYTKEEFGDFVFRAKFRLTGAGGNSGVQFRSERRDNGNCRGYQADIDRDGQWIGCLYEQDGRGIWVGRGTNGSDATDGKRERTQFANSAELLKLYKVDEWNDYEITAQGSKLTVRLNGELMCSVDDRDAKESRARGVIAVQMHQGPPMRVEYKEVKIKVLK